ncbi:MAG TPA: 2,3-diaminopropionate biosynthesis protein SbnB [Stenotrophomonas sp.]|nr:2,3-diaminopropionate biosynthesis protein SbnB [Stenotrophomonas sp.]
MCPTSLPAADPSTPADLLYLSRQDLIVLGGTYSQPYVDAANAALLCHQRGDYVQPLKPYLRWPGATHIADRIIAMPGYLGGPRPVAGLKWIGSRRHNPERFGLERASALIVLNDPDSNYPIAILEGGLISGMRTAAITAIGARHLAGSGFQQVAVIGCGAIARMQLQTLLEQFPSISQVSLFDVAQEAATALAATLGQHFGEVRWNIARNAEQAVRGSEVVVTCTVTDTPYLPFDWLAAGSFVANVSIMDVHKEVYEQADKVVVDDWEQSNRERKILHQLVLEGRFSRAQLHAELGEIVAGQRPGRENASEIILLNPMGMALVDLACAQRFLERAQQAGVGRRLPLYG